MHVEYYPAEFSEEGLSRARLVVHQALIKLIINLALNFRQPENAPYRCWFNSGIPEKKISNIRDPRKFLTAGLAERMPRSP